MNATSVGASPAALSHGLDVIVLGSGSSGNATLVRSSETALLIDCGFSGVELGRRLATQGLQAEDIDAVLLTHEHGDHTQALRPLARRAELRLLASPGTLQYISLGRRARCVIESVEVGVRAAVGDIAIHAFTTSHDTAQPQGYVLSAGTARLGYATDLGCFDSAVLQALRGCTLLCLESNHDVTMLRDGPYPAYLKKRIASALGHLSNEQSACLLAEVATPALRSVCAMHLSEANNQPELVGAALRQALRDGGFDCQVLVAQQKKVVALSA